MVIGHNGVIGLGAVKIAEGAQGKEHDIVLIQTLPRAVFNVLVWGL